MREKIEFEAGGPAVLIKMAEGNPGAISVLGQFHDDPLLLLDMDDMNLRGCQIWVAFKDFAGGDIAVLKHAVRDRSAKLVEIVNTESGLSEQAVTSGGSYRSQLRK